MHFVSVCFVLVLVDILVLVASLSMPLSPGCVYGILDKSTRVFTFNSLLC